MIAFARLSNVRAHLLSGPSDAGVRDRIHGSDACHKHERPGICGDDARILHDRTRAANHLVYAAAHQGWDINRGWIGDGGEW